MPGGKLSRGTAFAFECSADDDGYYGPCRNAKAASSNAAVATVYPSYMDTLERAYNDGDAGPRSRTAFVVVALEAGKTALKVRTSDGDVTIDVTVSQ